MERGFFIILGLFAASLAGNFNEKLGSSDMNVKRARRISRCANAAARAFFTPSNDVSIIVANRSYKPDLVRESLKGIFANGIVKIFTKIPNESKGKSSPYGRDLSYVLIDNTVNLRRHLEDSLVSRWAEYIIVTETNTEWLSKFADYLWKLGFIKVAFVRVTSNGEMNLLRLIRHNSSRNSPPKLVTYDLCNETSSSSSGSLGENQETRNIVDPFSSLSHTPVNTTLTFARVLEGTGEQMDFGRTTPDGEIRSLGVDVIDIFASKYNFEVIRYQRKNKVKEGNQPNWTDAMYGCVAGEFDVFYSPQPPSRSFERGLLDAVNWYKYETLIFVDSLKISLHSFESLLKPYNGYLLICTFLLIAAFWLFAYFIDISYHRGLIRERIAALTIWSIFTVQPLPRLPRRFSLRCVLGMWILHNHITSTLYTATFSSELTAMDSHLLRSFQDVLDSGRPICSGEVVKELFNDTNDSQMLAIFNRLEVILPKNAFNKILNEGYIGSRHSTYIQEHNWKHRKNDSLRLYSLTDSIILTYPSFYFAKRQHPYGKEFRKSISIVREAGLVEYLNNQYTRKVKKTQDEMLLSTNDGQFLKLKHLAVVFYILAIGHLISVVVFLIELYMYKRSVRQCNRRDFTKLSETLKAQYCKKTFIMRN